jgi:hypothetical protein
VSRLLTVRAISVLPVRQFSVETGNAISCRNPKPTLFASSAVCNGSTLSIDGLGEPVNRNGPRCVSGLHPTELDRYAAKESALEGWRRVGLLMANPCGWRWSDEA